MITKKEISTWFCNINQTMSQNKDYLTELDSAIGDADHGLNISRGFSKVEEKLQTIDTCDIGELLKQVSMVIMSSVGGASGSLYGTMLYTEGFIVGIFSLIGVYFGIKLKHYIHANSYKKYILLLNFATLFIMIYKTFF